MQAPPHMMVDHIDGDGLNDRRYNMRIVTNQQNASNRHFTKRGISGYLGVYPQGSKWVSMIRVSYKLIRIGVFSDPIDAANAYDQVARSLRGPHTAMNFPTTDIRL